MPIFGMGSAVLLRVGHGASTYSKLTADVRDAMRQQNDSNRRRLGVANMLRLSRNFRQILAHIAYFQPAGRMSPFHL